MHGRRRSFPVIIVDIDPEVGVLDWVNSLKLDIDGLADCVTRKQLAVRPCSSRASATGAGLLASVVAVAKETSGAEDHDYEGKDRRRRRR